MKTVVVGVTWCVALKSVSSAFCSLVFHRTLVWNFVFKNGTERCDTLGARIEVSVRHVVYADRPVCLLWHVQRSSRLGYMGEVLVNFRKNIPRRSESLFWSAESAPMQFLFLAVGVRRCFVHWLVATPVLYPSFQYSWYFSVNITEVCLKKLFFVSVFYPFSCAYGTIGNRHMWHNYAMT